MAATTTADPRRRPTSSSTPGWVRWANDHRKWLFAAPAMVFVAVLIIFPVGWTGYLSLTDAEGSVRAESEFIGFANYLEVLASRQAASVLAIRASLDDGATRKTRSRAYWSEAVNQAPASSGVRSGVIAPEPPAAARSRAKASGP